MKTTFLTAIVTLVWATNISLGQNIPAATAPIPSIPYEIINQPDSPLSPSVDDRIGSGLPGGFLRLKNEGTSSIKAFVLSTRADDQTSSLVVFLGSKGLLPGKTHLEGVMIRKVPENARLPAISIDYVRFADDTSWGPDSLGQAKEIDLFLDGRSLAIKRLEKLLDGQDSSDFFNEIEKHTSSSFGVTFRIGENPSAYDFFTRGYQEIIDILRRMKKRNDEALRFARKLEVQKGN